LLTLSKNGQLDKLHVNRIFYSSEDYDEFGASLQNANVEEKLLEPGSFKGYANIVLTPNLIVNNFKINKKVLQIGTGATGYITFTIWDPNFSFNWRKHEMKEGMIGILWKNEHESVSGAGINGLPISVKESYFKEICQNAGYPELFENLKKREVLYVSELHLKQIRKLVKFVTQQKKLADNLIYELVEEELIELLINCLLSAFPGKLAKDMTYPKFAKIIDFIHGNLSEITSIYQICHNTNIPERTLRRLINKKYDLSPKTYLNKLRLNEVRKNLKSNTENYNIFQVASEFNFWHMGQFTRDYKQLFGELPSETLIKSRAY